MVSTVTLALIGLALLIPLEIILIIIVYLRMRSRVPKGPYLPSPLKKPRYPWESTIAPRQQVRRSYRKVAVVIFLAVAFIAVLAFLYVISGALFDVTPDVAENVSENTSVNETQFNLSTVLNTTPFINHTFSVAPQLNVSQASSFYDRNTPYIWAVSLIVFLGSTALLLFSLLLTRRRSALLRQAAQTADSLTEPKTMKRYRRYLAILLILVGIILLILRFRENLTGFFS